MTEIITIWDIQQKLVELKEEMVKIWLSYKTVWHEISKTKIRNIPEKVLNGHKILTDLTQENGGKQWELQQRDGKYKKESMTAEGYNN